MKFGGYKGEHTNSGINGLSGQESTVFPIYDRKSYIKRSTCKDLRVKVNFLIPYHRRPAGHLIMGSRNIAGVVPRVMNPV